MAQSELEMQLTKTQRGCQLLATYFKLGADGSDEELLTTLLCTENSYHFAQNTARHLLGKDGRARSSYDADKAALMDYTFDEEVDPDVEKNAIKLLASTINMYLADKQGPLDLTKDSDKAILAKVKVLMIQIITRGLMDLIEPLINIPAYIKPVIDNAMESLKIAAEEVFNDWINDLIELGNEHLVDYMSGLGVSIFGSEVTTKPSEFYDNAIQQYRTTIKHPTELYARYKLRRAAYRKYTSAVTQQNLYDLFDITDNAFNSRQRVVIDEFQSLFNSDESSLYIQKLIIGNNSWAM